MKIIKLSGNKYQNLLLSNKSNKNLTDKSLPPVINAEFFNNKSIKLGYVDNSLLSINQIYKIISYVVSINVSRRNIIFNAQTPKGSVIINTSSGKLGFSGAQKNKKFSLITMLKTIIYNYNFLNNKPVLLKLKGFKYYNKLIIQKLKTKLKIKLIVFDNSIPHNGCRPRKIKRK